MLILTGCSNSSSTYDDAGSSGSFEPETTAAPSQYSVQTGSDSADPQPKVLDILLSTDDPAAANAPETEPEEEPAPLTDILDLAEPTFDPSPSYTYEKLADPSFGFTFAYPVGWENLPGKHTVCFRENAADGEYPARVAITRKTLAHSPKESVLLSQFQSYMETIYEQYDPETFELGTLFSSASFMGQTAQEITYLAYSGETEIIGYACCSSIGRNVYVFHFTCAYDEYESLRSAMLRMRDSASVIG